MARSPGPLRRRCGSCSRCPLVWLAHSRRAHQLQSPPATPAGGAASLLLAALALALARPVISTQLVAQSIVYAVDVSHSVASPAIAEAARRIDELNAALRPAHSRIVVFGATARAVDNTAALRELAQARSRRADRRSVPIAAAPISRRRSTRRAASWRPTTCRGSCCSATAGRRPATCRPRSRGWRRRTFRCRSSRSPRDRSATPGSTRSTCPALISRGGDVPRDGQHRQPARRRRGRRAARGRQGRWRGSRSRSRTALTAVTLDVAVDAPGAHGPRGRRSRCRAIRCRRTTRLRRGSGPTARARALRRRRAGERAVPVGRARRPGSTSRVRPPSALPATAAGFDPYDVVVLSDVARAAIPTRDGGAAGLGRAAAAACCVAGGEAVFGDRRRTGNTPLERLDPGDLRAQGRAVGRAGHRARPIVEHGRHSRWTLQGGGAGGRRRHDRRAVGRHPDLQRQFDWDVTLRNVGRNRDVIREKIAAIEPGGHTLIFPGARAGVPRAPERQGARQARHPAVGRPDLSRRLRGAGQEDGRGADHGVVGRGRPVGRPGAAAQHRQVGQGAGVHGRGREGAAADLRQGSEERATPAFDEKAIVAGREEPGVPAGTWISTHMPPLKGLHRDGAQGLGARGARDRRRRSAAGVLAGRARADGGVRVGRQGSLGRRLGRSGAATGRSSPPSCTRSSGSGRRPPRSRSRPDRFTARRDRSRSRSRRATPQGQYRDLLHPSVRVRAGDGATRDVAARQVAPGRYEATVVADAAQLLSVSVAGAGADDTAAATSRARSCRIRWRSTASRRRTKRCCGRSRRDRRRWRPTPAALSAPRAIAGPSAGRCGRGWSRSRSACGSWICCCGGCGFSSASLRSADVAHDRGIRRRTVPGPAAVPHVGHVLHVGHEAAALEHVLLPGARRLGSAKSFSL